MRPFEHKSLGSGTLPVGVAEMIKSDGDVSDVTQAAEPLLIVKEGSEKVRTKLRPSPPLLNNTMKVPTDTDSVVSSKSPYALLTHTFLSLSHTRSRLTINISCRQSSYISSSSCLSTI